MCVENIVLLHLISGGPRTTRTFHLESIPSKAFCWTGKSLMRSEASRPKEKPPFQEFGNLLWKNILLGLVMSCLLEPTHCSVLVRFGAFDVSVECYSFGICTGEPLIFFFEDAMDRVKGHCQRPSNTKPNIKKCRWRGCTIMPNLECLFLFWFLFVFCLVIIPCKNAEPHPSRIFMKSCHTKKNVVYKL